MRVIAATVSLILVQRKYLVIKVDGASKINSAGDRGKNQKLCIIAFNGRSHNSCGRLTRSDWMEIKCSNSFSYSVEPIIPAFEGDNTDILKQGAVTGNRQIPEPEDNRDLGIALIEGFIDAFISFIEKAKPYQGEYRPIAVNIFCGRQGAVTGNRQIPEPEDNRDLGIALIEGFIDAFISFIEKAKPYQGEYRPIAVNIFCGRVRNRYGVHFDLDYHSAISTGYKSAATWTKVDKEISSLNEHPALSTPGPLAAKKVIQLSDATIKAATASLVDRRNILSRAVSIPKANPTIRRLSEDHPLDARKLGQSSSREEVRRTLPDGTSSADIKLKAKPIVGSDALEKASLRWTERPKYVELSALLSITDDKGAALNSPPKSQLSWIGSDEHSQVAKPTGKPTTCAGVDIRERCESRTTTEAVKLPISSCTPSKVASLIVNTVAAQDLDSPSLKPDYGEPDSPSYTQLATLITGDSDDHTGAEERRLRPNKPYTTRQIRKLLAGFKKSAQKAFAVLRMIRRTFSRITRTDFEMLYGAYVRPLLEYANPFVYSGRTKDVILIERVQRAATKKNYCRSTDSQPPFYQLVTDMPVGSFDQSCTSSRFGPLLDACAPCIGGPLLWWFAFFMMGQFFSIGVENDAFNRKSAIKPTSRSTISDRRSRHRVHSAQSKFCGIWLCQQTWPFCSVYKRGLPQGCTYRQLYLRLDEARLTFNADAFEGMEYLFKNQLLEDNFEDLIAYLDTAPGLNLVQRCRFLQSSTTSAFTADASLLYNHDSFERLIVKNNKGEPGRDLVLAYYNHSEVPTPPYTHSGNPISLLKGAKRIYEKTYYSHASSVVSTVAPGQYLTRCYQLPAPQDAYLNPDTSFLKLKKRYIRFNCLQMAFSRIGNSLQIQGHNNTDTAHRSSCRGRKPVVLLPTKKRGIARKHCIEVRFWSGVRVPDAQPLSDGIHTSTRVRRRLSMITCIAVLLGEGEFRTGFGESLEFGHQSRSSISIFGIEKTERINSDIAVLSSPSDSSLSTARYQCIPKDGITLQLYDFFRKPIECPCEGALQNIPRPSEPDNIIPGMHLLRKPDGKVALFGGKCKQHVPTPNLEGQKTVFIRSLTINQPGMRDCDYCADTQYWPGHSVMSGPGGVGGPPGGGPGMPPPLGPPGPDPISMRQRPSGPPLMPGGGIPPGAGPGIQGPSPHHPSMRFHQAGAGGYPGPPVEVISDTPFSAVIGPRKLARSIPIHYLRRSTIAQQYPSELAQQLSTVNQYCTGSDYVDEAWQNVKGAMLAVFSTVCSTSPIRPQDHWMSAGSLSMLPTSPPQITGERNCGSYNHCTTSTQHFRANDDDIDVDKFLLAATTTPPYASIASETELLDRWAHDSVQRFSLAPVTPVTCYPRILAFNKKTDCEFEATFNLRERTNAMRTLNTATSVERLSRHNNQWQEQYELMLRQLEQMNNELIMSVKSGIDSNLVSSLNLETYGVQDSTIRRKTTYTPRRNQTRKENETSTLPHHLSACKVESTSHPGKSVEEKPETATSSCSILYDVSVTNSVKQDKRTSVPKQQSSDHLADSGDAQSHFSHSKRRQCRNTRPVHEQPTETVVDNPDSSLREPPGSLRGCSRPTVSYNTRGGRRPSRSRRNRGRAPRGSRGRGLFTHPPSTRFHDALDFTDSDDSEVGVYGFTKEEEFQLLCQGIKPWEPEAFGALQILNGIIMAYYDYQCIDESSYQLYFSDRDREGELNPAETVDRLV
ncbi:F-box protein 8 [Clonorchis sinensis]|uniref:F-box protein 8 n=1 Tax=Clonorchis sinensis TaxID=79923 RepID=G7YI50_CLOSI|nr:F-box protein 8 [Clonorchis sinensis]